MSKTNLILEDRASDLRFTGLKTIVILYTPKGEPKTYQDVRILFSDEISITFRNNQNGEKITSNLPYTIVESSK